MAPRTAFHGLCPVSRAPSGQLAGGHADGVVETDDLAVEHAALEDVSDEDGVLFRSPEAGGEGDLFAKESRTASGRLAIFEVSKMPGAMVKTRSAERTMTSIRKVLSLTRIHEIREPRTH